MSDSVDLRLLAEVKTRLERVSTANGFDFNVERVAEPNRLGTNASPLPRSFELRVISISPNEAFDLPGNPPAVGQTLELWLLAHESHSDASTSGRDRDAMMMISQARRAVTQPPADPHLWHTFGGLAIDAEFGEAARIKAGDGTPAGWSIPLLIHYRHDENDSTQVRF